MAEHWFHRNRGKINPFIRIVFGIIWLIDASFKFQPGFADTLSQMITAAGQGQPAWLLPWFNFWAATVAPDPTFWVYLVGGGELLIGLALVLGGMRKITYVVGMVLSLFIWAVPEGFGGAYGPSSTDIGTGIIYAMTFLALMAINADYGPSKFSVDKWLEKRFKWWKKLAEFN
ncbi:MAG: DoxX family protein [Candidatus Marsarchaeota archaeon]|nr:DoxX family protein [Candidatus Marsarchaeota archaeon]